jgi:hypothetical protein
MATDPSSPAVDPRDKRLHADSSESSWRGHTFRYRLAAGFCKPGDTVVDAACGSGYGQALLGDVHWVGVDNDPAAIAGEAFEFQREPGELRFIEADLQEWEPDFAFDSFIGFETIEHLPDYGPYIDAAKQAGRWIVLSAPVVPTTHLNPFHAHNFAPGELASLFIDSDWALYQSIVQPSELSEVYVFSRR